jgi:MFS transporter, SP family, major inositol transporter
MFGCIITYSWFINSAQLFIFTSITEFFGMYVMFFIFAGINLFGAIGTLVLLPETKGKSIEEIEKILGR